jgi:hypothetical protein
MQGVDDDLAVGGVERARRLVGEQQLRFLRERARDGDALLLAAGQFRGLEVPAAGESDLVEDEFGAAPCARGVEAQMVERQHDLLHRSQRGNRLKPWNTKPVCCRRKRSSAAGRKRARSSPSAKTCPNPVEQARQDRQQRALAAARRPGNEAQFRRENLDRQIAQHVRAHLAGDEGLADRLRGERGVHRSSDAGSA